MADIYEDKNLIGELTARIAAVLRRPLTIMEVCGTHTMSIAASGLRSLLPPGLKLISGPGCPVCVTDSSLVSAALALARLPRVTLTTFGDMLRVPAGGQSLQSLREQGADVRLVLSPLDALELAQQEKERQVVFFAVGFETTAPLTASTLELARELALPNFSVLSAHKTMPAALRALLGGGAKVDGLLCPGHVAAVTGADSFDFVSRELACPRRWPALPRWRYCWRWRPSWRCGKQGRPDWSTATSARLSRRAIRRRGRLWSGCSCPATPAGAAWATCPAAAWLSGRDSPLSTRQGALRLK